LNYLGTIALNSWRNKISVEKEETEIITHFYDSQREVAQMREKKESKVQFLRILRETNIEAKVHVEEVYRKIFKYISIDQYRRKQRFLDLSSSMLANQIDLLINKSKK
jgi:hypothetical protein